MKTSVILLAFVLTMMALGECKGADTVVIMPQPIMKPFCTSMRPC